jgi:hypothetical protein
VVRAAFLGEYTRIDNLKGIIEMKEIATDEFTKDQAAEEKFNAAIKKYGTDAYKLFCGSDGTAFGCNDDVYRELSGRGDIELIARPFEVGDMLILSNRAIKKIEGIKGTCLLLSSGWSRDVGSLDVVTIRAARKGSAEARAFVAMLVVEYRKSFVRAMDIYKRTGCERDYWRKRKNRLFGYNAHTNDFMRLYLAAERLLIIEEGNDNE